MSEEEIIEEINDLIEFCKEELKAEHSIFTEEHYLALQGILDLYNKEKEENKKLKKYDYRNIKLEEKNKISSIHFTREQLDLMNLGIALYVGIPKILADEKDEESDI